MSETARHYYLYYNVTPQADGLYHCPWENDLNSNCQHEPKKLKCHYEYASIIFNSSLSDTNNIH